MNKDERVVKLLQCILCRRRRPETRELRSDPAGRLKRASHLPTSAGEQAEVQQ